MIKNSKHINLLLLIVCTLLYVSCATRINTQAELFHWLHDADHGFVKSKQVGDYKLTAKYLPPDVLAYLEWRHDNEFDQERIDSLIRMHSNSVTILFTIEPREMNWQRDVMTDGVANYEAYRDRMMQLNFNVSEYFRLETAEASYIPVLANMENLYNLSGQRTLYLVFTPLNENDDLLSADQLKLKFSDAIFNTGINYFGFNRFEIEDIPGIHIRKNRTS